MRITYRNIPISYNVKGRYFSWAHGSASSTKLIKAQINNWLAGNFNRKYSHA